jgi:hypothetical protein
MAALLRDSRSHKSIRVRSMEVTGTPFNSTT